MTKRPANHVRSGNSGLLLLRLQNISDIDGRATVGYAEIAEELHCSVSTAVRCIDRLVRAGLITKVPSGVGSPNGYLVVERADAPSPASCDGRSYDPIRGALR